MVLALKTNKIYKLLERWKLYRVHRRLRKGLKILIAVVLGALLLAGLYVKAAVLILMICMVFSVVLTYASLMAMVSKTKEDTKRVLDSFIIENAQEIYNSVKNGNHQAAATYSERLRIRLTEELGLSRAGNTLRHRDSNSAILFSYDNSLTAQITGGVLELKTSFDLVFPIEFAGETLSDLRIPLEVKSLYVVKY